MELFTISLPSVSRQTSAQLMALLTGQAINDMNTRVFADGANAALHKRRQSNSQALVHFRLLNGAQVQCLAVLPFFQLQSHAPALYKATAAAVSEYIVSELEDDLILSIIKRKYECDAEELELIVRYCCDIMYGKPGDGMNARFLEADLKRRKVKIADELELFLSKHTVLNLDGFITFRLKAYRKELEEIIEYALDEYLLDKQYQEFISLVRYFVCLQETKVDQVHLLHKGEHEFVMYNAVFNPIESKPQTDRIVAEMLEAEMNMEDMVISSLITISPKKIKIHTRQPELNVIRVIESIFGERVEVCVSCGMCQFNFEDSMQR